ncbi:hypothetical protein [Streptomyces ipomoeae]|nr:hypothetical protein [Streptomyces ipomoeae]
MRRALFGLLAAAAPAATWHYSGHPQVTAAVGLTVGYGICLAALSPRSLP